MWCKVRLVRVKGTIYWRATGPGRVVLTLIAVVSGSSTDYKRLRDSVEGSNETNEEQVMSHSARDYRESLSHMLYAKSGASDTHFGVETRRGFGGTLLNSLLYDLRRHACCQRAVSSAPLTHLPKI